MAGCALLTCKREGEGGAYPGEGGLVAEVREEVLGDGEGGEEGGEVVEDVEEGGVVGIDLL